MISGGFFCGKPRIVSEIHGFKRECYVLLSKKFGNKRYVSLRTNGLGQHPFILCRLISSYGTDLKLDISACDRILYSKRETRFIIEPLSLPSAVYLVKHTQNRAQGSRFGRGDFKQFGFEIHPNLETSQMPPAISGGSLLGKTEAI